MGLIGIWQTLHQAAAQLAGYSVKNMQKGRVRTGWDANPSDGVLDNESKIVELLMQAIDNQADVRISFGNPALEYKTRFLPDRAGGPGSRGAPSSAYLREMSYILLAPTGQTDCDARLKAGRVATLSFVHGNKVNTFTSSLAGGDGLFLSAGGAKKTASGGISWLGASVRSKQPPVRKMPAAAVLGQDRVYTPAGAEGAVAQVAAQPFKMVFPDQIARKPLRRDTVRVESAHTTGVTLRVKDEEGDSFLTSIVDISVGGCSFRLPRGETPPPSRSRLELTFQWGDDEEEEVVRHGILFRMQTQRGQVVGHVGFDADDYESVRATGALVTHLERIHLRARHNWSPTETEHLAELYRSTPSSAMQEREARANHIRTV